MKKILYIITILNVIIITQGTACELKNDSILKTKSDTEKTSTQISDQKSTETNKNPNEKLKTDIDLIIVCTAIFTLLLTVILIILAVFTFGEKKELHELRAKIELDLNTIRQALGSYKESLLNDKQDALDNSRKFTDDLRKDREVLSKIKTDIEKEHIELRLKVGEFKNELKPIYHNMNLLNQSGDTMLSNTLSGIFSLLFEEQIIDKDIFLEIELLLARVAVFSLNENLRIQALYTIQTKGNKTYAEVLEKIMTDPNESEQIRKMALKIRDEILKK